MGEIIGFVIGIGVVTTFILRLLTKRDGTAEEIGVRRNDGPQSEKLSSEDVLKTDDRTS